jgi:hypothetical protein
MQADVLLNTSHPHYFPNDNTFNQSWPHSLHFPGRLGCSDMGSLPWSCSNCKTFTGLGGKSKRSWTGNEFFLFFSIVLRYQKKAMTCSYRGDGGRPHVQNKDFYHNDMLHPFIPK